MRGAIPGLRSPHPLESLLPDVYFEESWSSGSAVGSFPPGTYVAVIGERDLEGIEGARGPALRSLVGEWMLAVAVERGVNAPLAQPQVRRRARGDGHARVVRRRDHRAHG